MKFITGETLMILCHAEFQKWLISWFSFLHHCQVERSCSKITECHQLDHTVFMFNIYCKTFSKIDVMAICISNKTLMIVWFDRILCELCKIFRGDQLGLRQCKNLCSFSLFCSYCKGYGLLSWLLCFLCFTSLVSVAGSYTEDELPIGQNFSDRNKYP